MPYPLDAAAVRSWCGLALEALGRERERIDAINVYPVADGDTGTNLYLTLESAARAVEAAFDGHASAGTAPASPMPSAPWHTAPSSGRAATPARSWRSCCAG